jgi:hypothetical protein
MTTTTIVVNFSDEEALDAAFYGPLIITDSSALLRPALPGQYFKQCRFDTSHSSTIFALSEPDNGYVCHIMTTDHPEVAKQKLSDIISAFVQELSMGLSCDAIASFYVAEEFQFSTEYGFDDGSFTLEFFVHCRIQPNDAESHILELMEDSSSEHTIVRPDNKSDLGFTAHRVVEDNSTNVS